MLEWEKDDCASVKLVKFDLLGLGMLSALHYMLDLVREHKGVEIDIAKLDLEDGNIYEMLRRLSEGPAIVRELATPFEMSMPAVCKHLRVLESAQLVRREVDGRVHRCALEAEPRETARTAWLISWVRWAGVGLGIAQAFLVTNPRPVFGPWAEPPYSVCCSFA